MANKHTYKRRQYFVKKNYQAKFILKFCLIVLCGTLVSSGLLFLFTRGTLTSSSGQFGLVVKDTAFAILPYVALSNIITFILVVVAAIIVILFISHKIAGPLFRFEKELNEIGKGDLTKTIKLRKKDQFKDLAESLNNMTTDLRSRVLVVKEEVNQVFESARKHSESEKVIEELNQLDQLLSKQFKI
jgi:methyl-accepting chemotaxis protein